MIDNEYKDFTGKQKEEFMRLINILLARTFILRDIFISKEEGIRINEDFRFIERHFKVFEEYLNMAGWSIYEDSQFGVTYAANSLGSCRVRLDKLTTYILYILRLIYEEEREKLSLSRNAVTTVEEIVSKLINLGVFERKPANDKMNSSLSILKNFNLIDKLEGGWDNAATRIFIYSSILFVVSNEKINNIFEYINKLKPGDIESNFQEEELA